MEVDTRLWIVFCIACYGKITSQQREDARVFPGVWHDLDSFGIGTSSRSDIAYHEFPKCASDLLVTSSRFLIHSIIMLGNDIFSLFQISSFIV